MTKKQQRKVINHMFSDEDRLIKELGKFMSIDSRANAAFVIWMVTNDWCAREDDPLYGWYTNAVTGEKASLNELKGRYKKTIQGT